MSDKEDRNFLIFFLTRVVVIGWPRSPLLVSVIVRSDCGHGLGGNGVLSCSTLNTFNVSTAILGT